MKELLLEKQKLEQLKADVNNMEYDALQRRFRRVNSTSLIPRVRTEYAQSLTSTLLLIVALCTVSYQHQHKSDGASSFDALCTIANFVSPQVFLYLFTCCQYCQNFHRLWKFLMISQVHESEYFRLMGNQ